MPVDTAVAPPRDRLMTLRETCAYLGRSRQWVRKLRRSGDFPVAYIIGRSPSFRLSEVDDWLETKRQHRRAAS